MKTTDYSTVREFRMPWISRFLIYFTLVAFAACIGLAVWWREHLLATPSGRFVVVVQSLALLMTLISLWVNHRTFVRLSPDRIEMCMGFSLRTILKSDIRSVGWFTPRGPALKLRDDAQTIVPVLMLEGMDTSLLRRWLGSDQEQPWEAGED